MDESTLVLSEKAGGYREFATSSALGEHFQCVWTNTLAPGRAGQFMVVPDGCVDLVWIEGELTVAGPDLTAFASRIRPGTSVVGIRFRPGAAHHWLGLPMDRIVGGRLPLAEFWGAAARDIAARMSDVAGAPERMRVLAESLGRLAADRDPPPSDMRFVFNAFRTESGGRRMAAILDRLAMSPRTLRRRCHEAFGYGPKTLDRILRFQRFLALARRVEEPQLAALAFEAGYADQAHLSREVRRLAGSPPAAILAQQRA